jgi:hypothetical protein
MKIKDIKVAVYHRRPVKDIKPGMIFKYGNSYFIKNNRNCCTNLICGKEQDILFNFPNKSDTLVYPVIKIHLEVI